ncbi:DUF2163 domain-containing protein [Rhizobiales bacterium RZME27]|uniref:DUF2163 domain-containing protein n=1 Tax=Endobacterium cereale TaxID=2663029 RepID=A0A6A8A852_9HYPH|nr:DUF2163 domain-containing protein [Endobacterium cereale]MEB2847143.1 DUF2163 domain-containing protein [Endobacterium cereale]MQY47442.1 DUF2163 domain-containing protein [Endobacterium cereale]
MRTIPAGLAAHLKGDVTTICHCWRVFRRDGVVLGFTDHDGDLLVDGAHFLASSGFSASEEEAEAGLSASAGMVAGGFSSDVIAETDLAAGVYDGARVELLVVNWCAPDQFMRLSLREIGEVSRAGGEFTAELRSLAHRLDQPQGRVYGRRCDASLGDGRCRVDLAAYRGHGTVLLVRGRSRLVVAGLQGFASGFFAQGVLRLEAGGELEADAHVLNADGTADLTLWLPSERDIAVGQVFSVTAGCDKAFATCRKKFGNQLNFQGFPHVPGSDFAYSFADGERLHDGSPIFP